MTTETAQSREENIGNEGLAIRKLISAIIITAVFWIIGVLMWQASGYIEALLNFAYLGSSVGLSLYAVLPRTKKSLGRKLAQFLVVGYMLFFMGFFISNNAQIEGFFFSLLTGVMGAALMHYLMAKILGPLLFGRLWCGWACWTAMVLDLLLFSYSPGRASHRLGHICYLHFFLSGAIVIFL